MPNRLIVLALFFCTLATNAVELCPTNATWRLFKGRTEASSPDITAWRTNGFNDAAFANAVAPFTYGESYGYGTDMSDMLNQYSCFFLRKTFVIADPAQVGSLKLGTKVDDGFVAWINGVEVQRTNMTGPPGDLVTIATLAIGAVEPVPFVFTNLPSPGSYLVAGTNVLAIQVFNTTTNSSDIVFEASLEAILNETNPPVVFSKSPVPGTLNSLSSITATFSEPVIGIDAADFLIDGFPADSMTGSGTNFTFSFAQPPYGSVQIGWRAVHGITDLATPGNPFDQTAGSANWFYTLVDVAPPVVTNLFPLVGVTVQSLTQIEITFSEDVLHVDAADLLINGQPATNVTYTPGLPYVFRFPPPANGPVTVAWAQGHGITDLAPMPNFFTGGAWNYTLDPNAGQGDLIINEFLANNEIGLLDEAGEAQGWIEIRNRGATTVNLANWALSDDPTLPGLWTFPTRSMAPGQYLVVFASGKDIKTPTGTNRMHTNFKLNGNGEHLGLYSPDSPRVLVHGFSPNFPEQRNDNSYGYDVNGALRYFGTPTPGGPNGVSSIVGVVVPVHFGVSRGFFTQPFTLTLSSETPGARIRYTTDGREPTELTGIPYALPLNVGTTMVIRASAFRTNSLPSSSTTHTYIFNATDAIKSLPVISLVTATNNLYGPSGIVGISGGTGPPANPWVPLTTNDYHNTDRHGIAWERPLSVELMQPSDNSGFQVNCGIRVHGSDYTRPRYQATDKFAYRLYFRGAYGAGKLEYPFFPGSAVQKFDQIILRAGHNDLNPFIRDEMTRRLSGQMGAVHIHGNLVNLFINGQYIGFFNPTERPDENWAQSWYQSEKSWDVIKQFSSVVNGDLVEYSSFNSYLLNQNITLPAVYQEVARRFDLTNFVDYLLLNVYEGMGDWPANNWAMHRERSTNGVWRYAVWDGEWGCGIYGRTVTRNTFTESGGGPDDGGLASTGSADIARYYQKLYTSPEFRLHFADRIHKQFFNGGVLTDSNISLLHTNLRAAMLPVLPGYDNAIATTWIPARRGVIMPLFDLYKLIASSNAPVLNQFGGRVPRGFNLTMAATNGGTIYYTTNGIDPRVPFTGAVSGPALAYTGAVALAQSLPVKARTLRFGTNWSALVDVVFEVGTLGVPLRVTEIMYNPPGGSIHEYLELMNIGSVAIDLSGMYFSEGIGFTFTPGAMILPGARLVLANNTDPAAFAAQYPGVSVHGYYSGNLNNAGERVTLRTSGGAIVFSVDYDDGGGWPTLADGFGRSLELLDVYGSPDDPANWRSSPVNGGTPGAAPAPVGSSTVVLNEVLAQNLASVNNGGTFPDFVELFNSGGSPINLAGWSLSDDGNARKFVFPSVSITAGGYLTVWCDATTNMSPGLHTGFTLDASGASVFLYDPATNRVDAISLGLQIADYSVGRVAGQWVLTTPTANDVNIAASLAPQSSLSINEWMANSTPGQSDWVEFYNSAALPVSLQGTYLSITNEVSQLTALSFVAPFGFAQIFADEGVGPAHVDFKLPAAGSFIALSDATAIEVNRVNYNNAVEGLTRGRLPNGTVTFANFPGSSSPGATNYVVVYSGPVLNEVLARNISAVTNAGRVPDFIELFNPGGSTFSLTGMSLSIGKPEAGQWLFGAASIPAGGYLIVWCDADVPASAIPGNYNTGRTLDGQSGGVYLFNTSGQQVNSVEYGFQVANKSIGLSAGQWRLLSTPTPGAVNSAVAALGPNTALRINEWMADAASGPDWFELFNSTNLPVDLGGLILTDDPSFAGTNQHRIAPLSFIGPRGFTKWIADNAAGQGRDHVGFGLDANGESLRIYTTNGTTILDTVAFGPQWRGISQGRLPDGAAIIESFPNSASPGEANYQLAGLVINEILTHTDPPLEDAVEIRNPGASAVNVGGWFLSNSQDDFKKYRITDGTTIAAGGFLVLYEGQFNTGPAAFTFNAAHGDEVWLSAADALGNLTGIRVGAKFGAARNGVSFGRYPTSVGVDYPALSARTFGQDSPANVAQFRTGTGAANAAPAIGPVVINEIHYNPAPGAGSDDEYIELLNTTGGVVQLFDPAATTNHWRLRDGVEFTFPAGATLSANQFALVVNFDPASTVLLDAFRARNAVPPSAAIFGPFIGGLNNAGDSLELVRPDSPQPPGASDAGFVPYVVVDKVEYSDAAPWPSGDVDGGGLSLQRKAPSLYGNEPVNWVASAPTAGTTNGSGVVPPPAITMPPQPAALAEGANAAVSVIASGSGPLRYQWRQNGLNLPGATNTSFLIDYAVGENAGFYDVIVDNAGGAALSASAYVRVIIPPIIVTAPTNVPVRPGSNAVFTVTARGETPLTYQWRKNGVVLPGETAVTLLRTNVQLVDDADYQVTVSNPSGTATVTARLFILINPVLVQSPLGQSVPVNSLVTLSASFTGNPLPFTNEWRRGSIPLQTNVVYGTQDFFTFTATNVPATIQYRVVVRNMAQPVGVASTPVNIVTLADTDGDGIPDAWETQFGLNPNSAADRNLDADGDGLSNWQEFTAGTNPSDTNSYLRVSLQVAATPAVQFSAISNHTYTVQYADVLGQPWQRLANVLARTNNRVELIPDPAWTTNRFYRLVTPWQP